MDPADRAVLGEPPLAVPPVDRLAAGRPVSPGHPLDYRRADAAADGISGSLHSHLPIIRPDRARPSHLPG